MKKKLFFCGEKMVEKIGLLVLMVLLFLRNRSKKKNDTKFSYFFLMECKRKRDWKKMSHLQMKNQFLFQKERAKKKKKKKKSNFILQKEKKNKNFFLFFYIFFFFFL
jgi:hypothetical protein